VAASLIVFVLGGLVAWRIWPDPARVTVEPGAAGAGETLVVASGTIDLAGLDRAAAAIGRPDAVQPGADGTYLLSQPVMIGPGGSLVLDDVELRLLSSPERFVGVEARDGDLHLRQSTVTSWDPVTEGADTDVSDGRAYVLARDGARMDVSGSTVAMLGYDAFERYGVSWRTAGTDGAIDTATFRGNFYGAYMNGVEPMEITDSVVEDSVSYGLDPHSASRDFTISGNTFRNNGKHGIILAEDVTGAVVTGNEAYGNAEHGIVVFSGSDGAVVEGNRAHDNGIAGISVNGSAGVVVRDNDVWANTTGIAIQDNARATLVEANRVSGNRQDGILVTSERATATVTNNRLDHNSRAGIWVSDGQATIGPGNRIADNESGVRLVDETASVEVIDNILTENYKDGVSLVVSAGVRISGNQIVDNKSAFSVRTPGDAGPFLDGNELRDNEVGPERVREPDPVDPGDPVDPVPPVG
jgi:parallel beta-helix repeat protein